VEVALQYQQPDWDLVAYEKFLSTEAEAAHIGRNEATFSG
jgi:hypothetical protein